MHETDLSYSYPVMCIKTGGKKRVKTNILLGVIPSESLGTIRKLRKSSPRWFSEMKLREANISHETVADVAKEKFIS